VLGKIPSNHRYVPKRTSLWLRFLSWSLTPVQIGFFFLFICYGWLLFRAHSFDQIITFSSILLGLAPSHPSVIPKPTTAALFGIVVLATLQLLDYRSGKLESFFYWPAARLGALYAIIIFILVMGTSNAPVQFIYFQF
jgi:alginate O-acetyltransferase complex protein AlgI